MKKTCKIWTLLKEWFRYQSRSMNEKEIRKNIEILHMATKHEFGN